MVTLRLFTAVPALEEGLAAANLILPSAENTLGPRGTNPRWSGVPFQLHSG